MEGNDNNDTKLKKIFVGGLAWETKRDTMRLYFEQFGEITEAVVISDKNTGRSKGYGFVTFKEAEAAMRACENANPVIDGRRANCNLAYLGSQKPPPPSSPRHGTWRFRSQGGVGLVAPSSSPSSSPFAHQQQLQPFPYSGYSQEGMYPMQYYNHHLYGGQQISPYIGHSSSGMFHGFYPFYAQYNAAQSTNQAQAQAPPPPLLQYPYLPHQPPPPPPPILSLPTSLALSLSSSSTSISAAITSTKTVVITTKTTKTTPELARSKDGHEAITSSIKLED